MLRWIILLVLAVIVGFAGYISTQPATFTVSRTALIDASPQAVYPHINNFRKWQAWSPWAKRDPKMEVRYSGPESGTGAEFGWQGNDEVGKGSMRIIEAVENERVEIALKFEEPFASSNAVSLALMPEGEATRVRWTINGPKPFMERAIMTVLGIDLEAMIGSDYETGLASLKKVVEAEAAASAASAASPPTAPEPVGDPPATAE